MSTKYTNFVPRKLDENTASTIFTVIKGSTCNDHDRVFKTKQIIRLKKKKKYRNIE